MTDIILPRQGLAMDEGTITEWYVEAGEWVEEAEAVLQAEGEKSTFDIQAPIAGYLGEVLVREGELIPVGAVLGRIYSREEWESRGQ